MEGSSGVEYSKLSNTGAQETQGDTSGEKVGYSGITLPDHLKDDEGAVETLRLFDQAYEIFMQEGGENNLDLQAQRVLVSDIVEKIRTSGKGFYYDNKLKYIDSQSGKTKYFTMREYLPADFIIAHLNTLGANTKDEDEKKRYHEIWEKLNNQAVGLTKNKDGRKTKKTFSGNSTKLLVRTQQEAELLQKSGLNLTDDQIMDNASSRVNSRRELRYTRRSKKKSQTADNAPPPVAPTPVETPKPEAAPAEVAPPPVETPKPEAAPAEVAPPPVESPGSESTPKEVAPPSVETPKPEAAPEEVASPPDAPVEEIDDSEEEVVSVPPTIEEIRYEMHIVNRQEDVQKRAREIAELQLREELRKGKWYNPKTMFRRAWLRICEEKYRQQYTQRAVEAMISNNNSYLQMDVVRNAAVNATHKLEEERRAGVAKAQSAGEILGLQKEGVTLNGQRVEEAKSDKANKLFVQHLLKSVVIDEIGRFTDPELRELSNLTSTSREKLNAQVQDTLRSWIGALYDENIMEGLAPDVKKLLNDNDVRSQLIEIFGKEANQYGERAGYFATDLIDIGQKIEQDRRDEKFSMDMLEKSTSVVFANMSWGAETNARLKWADKLISWAQKRRATGLILNPATVGAMASVASASISLGTGMSRSMINILAPGSGAIAGGVFAGIRRNYDLKVDRAAHQVEMAYGGVAPTKDAVDQQLSQLNGIKRRLAIASGAYGRAELETFSLDTMRAADLLSSVDNLLKMNLADTANQYNLLKAMAEIRARMSFSASEKVDLIRFESRESVEQSRLELIKAISQGKVALREKGMPDDEVSKRLDDIYTGFYEKFAGDSEDKEKDFSRYRRREALKAGVGGAVTGLVVGAVGKEVLEGAKYVAETVSPVFQPVVDGVQKSFENITETEVGGAVIESAVENKSALTEKSVELPKDISIKISTTQNDMQILFNSVESSSMSLTKNVSLQYNPEDHGITFIDSNTSNPIENLSNATLDEEGTISLPDILPEVIKNELTTAGFMVTETSTTNLVEGSAANTIESMTTGFKTIIPEGTHWVSDNGNWDLVADSDSTRVLINDAVFSEKGVIESFDKDASLIKNFQMGEVHEAPKEVLNPDGAWKEHASIDKLGWYSYNQPGSQENELKLFNYKEGSAVRLSMSGMGISTQSGLNPESLNVQDLIKGNDPEGMAVFTFNLPGQANEPLMVLADNNGNLTLDPLDTNPSHVVKYVSGDGTIKNMPLGELSRTVLNYDAYKDLPDGSLATEYRGLFDVFRVGGENGEFGVVSAGRYAMYDGQQYYDSFASIRGRGSMAQLMEEVVTHPEIRSTIIEQVSYDTVIEAPVEEEPPIVIPLAPRYPLEPLPPNLYLSNPPVSEYYSGENIEASREWIRANPQSHRPYIRVVLHDGTRFWIDSKEGERVKRDVKRERETVKRYIEAIKSSDIDHYKRLEDLARSMPPMSEKARVVVNVPAWMEEKNLYKLLEGYVAQKDKNGADLDPELFEINIIVNRKTGTPADNSVSEIERFIKDSRDAGKNYKINFVDVEFDPPFNNVGNARKVITDVTLMRSLQRRNQDNPLYIESEDADLIHVDPKTVINIVDKLDSNPHLDAVKGIQDRVPEIMQENDYVFLKNRISEFMGLVASKAKYRPENSSTFNSQWNRVVTGGWNTAYTAEAYALIGGYNPYATKGEDLYIGERITMARGNGTTPNTYVVGRVPTRSDSSPRRFIYEALNGVPAYSDSFEDEKVNKDIREKSPEELLKLITHYERIKADNVSDFSQMINSAFGFMKGTTPSQVEAEKSMRFVLTMIGFEKDDYEFTAEGNINIKNWSNISTALNDYRSRHKRKRNPGERISNKMM